MKVLITGGAGYIGSVMTRVLRGVGHEVLVLDSLEGGFRDVVPEGVTLLEGDCANLGALVSKDDGIEAVIHLAAYMQAGESMTAPEKYWQNNVVGTLNMLSAMRDLGIRKLVFASSAAVYGNPSSVPITEDAPTRPTNPYGMTKLAMDMAITSECWAHNLAATSLRFFNVAGAFEDAGERHSPETHILPLLFEAAAGKRDSFTLFGTDYPTPDGTCVRDYIHVYDLAQAALLALDKQQPGQHGIYNLGNGAGVSNKELVAVVEAVTGKKLPVSFGERRPGDPAELVASGELAKAELGWQPERADLESIVRDGWEFYTSRVL